MYETAFTKYKVVSFDTYTFKGFDFPLSWYKKLGFEEVTTWTLISGNVKTVLKKLKKNN